MPARKKTPKAPSKPFVPPPSTSLPVEKQKAQMLEHVESIANVGHVSASAIIRMRELIPPMDAVKVISGMMTATRWVGTGKNVMEVPDWRTREAGARVYLAYTEGLPIQRTETITKVVESEDQTMARAEKSPATRRHMRRELDRMDAEAAGETPAT